eukprot:2681483-Amphidinium_carterae.1
MSLMSVQRAPIADPSKRRSGLPENSGNMEGTLSNQQALPRTEQGRVSLTSVDGSELLDKEVMGSIREDEPAEKENQSESRRHAG